MNDAYVEAVLAVVETVGPGQVTTYGAIAAAVGRGGPRQVGRVMSLHGDAVAWWRVVHADGTPATCHAGAGPALLRAEGVRFRPDGRVEIPPHAGAARNVRSCLRAQAVNATPRPVGSAARTGDSFG